MSKKTSSVEGLPMEQINPDLTIQGRCNNARSSALAFERQSKRDNTMYNLGQLNKNINLEYTREEREMEVEERKRNRHKYRFELNSVLQHYRSSGGKESE